MGAIGSSEQGGAGCGSISKGFPRTRPCAELVRGKLFAISMFVTHTKLKETLHKTSKTQTCKTEHTLSNLNEFHRLYKTSGGATTGLWKHMISMHKDVKMEKDIQ